MQTILEAIKEVLPLTEIGVQAGQRTKLHASLQSVHSLHTAVYWLQDAEALWNKLQDGETISTPTVGQSQNNFLTPTFLGTQDRMDYLKAELERISQDLESYKEDSMLPPAVKYRVDQGYNNLMMAKFNNDMAIQFYGQINREQ